MRVIYPRQRRAHAVTSSTFQEHARTHLQLMQRRLDGCRRLPDLVSDSRVLSHLPVKRLQLSLSCVKHLHLPAELCVRSGDLRLHLRLERLGLL